MKIYDTKAKLSVKFNLVILLQVCISIIFIISLFMVFYTAHRDVLKKSYTSNLMSVYSEEEACIGSVISNINMLSVDNEFMDAMTYKMENTNEEEVHLVSKRLEWIKANNPMVESIFVVNRSLHLVYGTVGVMEMEKFFRDVYVYEDYPNSFWYNYRTILNEYQALPPTRITGDSTNKTVIPIVFAKIGNDFLVNNIVVNINAAKIFDDMEENKPTDNTFCLLINRQMKRAYNCEGLFKASIEEDIYETMEYSKIVTEISIDNEKYIPVFYSPSQSVLGYTYAAFIPQKDIYNGIIFSFIISTILGIITILLLVFLTKKNVESINMRLKNAVVKLEPWENTDFKEETLRDPISAFDEVVNKINLKISECEQTFIQTEDIVRKFYLISILNQGERSLKENDSFLKDTLEKFKYNGFCVVAMHLEFSDVFYDAFDKDKYALIYHGIKDIAVYLCQEKDIVCYALPNDVKDVLFFVLNMPNEKEDELMQIIGTIRDLLKCDEEYVTMNVYDSGIHNGIDELIQSHKHVMHELVSNISVGGKKSENMNFCEYFDEEKERYFLDLCISGNSKEGYKFIEDVVRECTKKELPADEIKSFLRRVLVLLFNMVRAKNIAFDLPISDDDYIESLMKNNIGDIQFCVRDLVTIIGKSVNGGGGVDMTMVKIYIDTHFNEVDCTLTQVAQMFNISPKYLSNRFKAITSDNFVSYLARKRITKAKELFKNGEWDIIKVGEAVGYPAVSTFIRVFKKIEGVSPQQYRNGVKEWRS